MASRKTKPVDIAVGNRIRLYRMKAKLSQTELGTRIGVTFQQIQKYEKGVNRVGAARLTEIAAVLGVPITAFFQGLGADSRKNSDHDPMTELLVAPRAYKLLQAFSRIPDASVQSAILHLVESIRAERPSRQK